MNFGNKKVSTYLLKGMLNTSYYHAHASIRRNRNQISEFVSQDNISLTTPIAISRPVTHEFAQRFLSNPACSFDVQSDFSLISPLISEEDNLFLCAPPSGEEIKCTTFDLAPDKSLGPDGFPPGFFQKYWTLVGNSVIRAVQAFFHSGKLLKEVNHTFLALIPKIDNPTSANHFKPISLCSTIYKVISKVLTRRLKVVMGKLIHPLQGAFVPERFIQDNILLAHEDFRRSGWLGFECISTASFSVLVKESRVTLSSRQEGSDKGILFPVLVYSLAELLARQLRKPPPINLSASPNLIGWDRICKPKCFGGIGLRKAEVNNIALQLKLLWKLLKDNNSFWVKLVHKKYVKNSFLLSHKPSVLASWQWKRLMSLRPLFRKGLRWQVGNGIKINFWYDNWVFQHPIADLVSPVSGSFHMTVSDFISQRSIWNIAKLACFLPSHLVSQVAELFLPSEAQEDELVWGLSSDGEYSVKSGALLVQGLVGSDVPKVSFSWIWKLNVPLKAALAISKFVASWFGSVDSGPSLCGHSACGFVIRNVQGDVVLAGAQALGSSVSILQAEAWGLWIGIRGALAQGISHLQVEGDNSSGS
ncbi:uncharacterized protein LOC130589452 [Beta vulgaris subsp. vulgaris]|uniref:uncharacterized protein LOC130589452 n=1 Tax=Beta vulgaris subsp. vulgaris TaxID=3555 RepID=UPI00254934A1|nr:uncharacterized protein LOC130589452 [Beta vulgaris subsp. vulgaris]